MPTSDLVKLIAIAVITAVLAGAFVFVVFDSGIASAVAIGAVVAGSIVLGARTVR